MKKACSYGVALSRMWPNGAEVLSLMRSGAIDGLSIGFKTKRSQRDKKSGIREILEADLWEVSVVTFPMLSEARVSQVKNLNHSKHLPTIREFERWLTQDAGLTRSEARTVIGKGFQQLASKQDAAGISEAALADKIRQGRAINQRQETINMSNTHQSHAPEVKSYTGDVADAF